ncbi:MAG TPA: hypothetical protein VM866_01755 [Pyrinomonadaceae bacterium]|jgi:uncharacterized protein (TIGR00725 family)|nr:hypothetical protein [Pyrinomonadaceae bacterium]
MKIKVGVMGSADDTLPVGADDSPREKAEALGHAVAARGLVVLTGGTTGLSHIAGRAAHERGALHVGVSPASDVREHVSKYKLPTAHCDFLIYTGFGLKGRNVVLVRSCDIVIFIHGSIGSLNELTIAYDEGRVIGCLVGTGGVADEASRLFQTFPKETRARVLYDDEPSRLLDACLGALRREG